MPVDKFFPLTAEEAKHSKNYGWAFVSKHKDRLITTTFEIGSIDFSLKVSTRFVEKDVVYEAVNQFYEMQGTNTTRIIVGAPIISERENPDLCKSETTIYPKPGYLTYPEKKPPENQSKPPKPDTSTDETGETSSGSDATG